MVVADKNLANTNETLESLSNNCLKHIGLTIEVEKSSSVKNALEKILEVFKKPPSVVVNCAGITRDNFILQLSEQDFEEVIDVNLKVNTNCSSNIMKNVLFVL